MKWIPRLILFYFFSSKQRELYEETFRPLVQSVLEGFNGTIFAYGQTGTGKTYTMQGKPEPSFSPTYPFFFLFFSLVISMPCLCGLEYANCIPCSRVRLTPKKGKGFEFDTKLHLMVKLQFQSSGECGVHLHCHYSQVHSDPEWYYLLGSHLWIK